MKKANSSETVVEIKFIGGSGRQEVNRILAKLVLEKLAEKQKEKEPENESSNIHQG